HDRSWPALPEEQRTEDDAEDRKDDDDARDHVRFRGRCRLACWRAATRRSHTLRTAPRPPRFGVTMSAARRAEGWASNTAKARPTVRITGTSGRSSPTQAHCADSRPSRSRSFSNTGSFSLMPWYTYLMPRSFARCFTWGESRPEMIATFTPESISRLMP